MRKNYAEHLHCTTQLYENITKLYKQKESSESTTIHTSNSKLP